MMLWHRPGKRFAPATVLIAGQLRLLSDPENLDRARRVYKKDPESLNRVCNEMIRRLRMGERRGTHWRLRREWREVRDNIKW